MTVSFSSEGTPHLIDASGWAFDAFASMFYTLGMRPGECRQRRRTSIGGRAGRHLPECRAAAHRGSWDPESRAHSENESVHLAELAKRRLNEAILIGELARGAQA